MGHRQLVDAHQEMLEVTASFPAESSAALRVPRAYHRAARDIHHGVTVEQAMTIGNQSFYRAVVVPGTARSTAYLLRNSPTSTPHRPKQFLSFFGAALDFEVLAAQPGVAAFPCASSRHHQLARRRHLIRSRISGDSARTTSSEKMFVPLTDLDDSGAARAPASRGNTAGCKRCPLSARPEAGRVAAENSALLAVDQRLVVIGLITL
jgi:hypothetical protein